jgi:ribosomal protein L11 methyltransferase
MMVDLLEDTIAPGSGVLDVGTGTGILAMAALRFGAARACGIDSDPVAIDCAREAAAVNGFGDELRFSVGALGSTPLPASDIVAANLDLRAVVAGAAELAGAVADGGRLLISGILEADEGEARAALEAVGTVPDARRARDGWLALSFSVPRRSR